jgi:hypothetical protein
MTRTIENHYLLLTEDWLLDEKAIIEHALKYANHGVDLMSLETRLRDTQQALHIRNMERYADGVQDFQDALETVLKNRL